MIHPKLIGDLPCADHGLYAHQTPTFDSYTASQEFPMHITEDSTHSSYKLVGEVAGVLKMTGDRLCCSNSIDCLCTQ